MINRADDDRPDESDSTKRTFGQAMSRGVFGLIRLLILLLLAPFRGYFSLRKSMTAASVIALLTSILALNVIWGFPWSGLMGACTAMLFVGLAINRLMRPKLQLRLSLPSSAITGDPFPLTVRLTNQSVFPALDLRVGWHREGMRDVYRSKASSDWDASPPVSVTCIRTGDQARWQGTMRFDQRGVHQLPAFQLSSSFPFHLFHYRHAIETETEIAITPAPLSADEDPVARVMLSSIGEWAKQLVAGAPVEYIGNREYQVGMHVRRWDFASWARLGRPIVREYQSPSVQAVTLVVDTSLNRSLGDEEAEWELERLLSSAATAVLNITSRRVNLKLKLTCDGAIDEEASQVGPALSEQCESMMIRLASAQAVDPQIGMERLFELIESSQRQPVLILSVFDLDSPERMKLASLLPQNATYLPVNERVAQRILESA